MDQEQLTPFEAFDLAVTRAGGQSALARICGCTPANINQLLQAKRELPAEYVLAVEAATHVARHDLRPDLYPRGLQDGVPFKSDAGAAAIGELAAGGPPEWPVAGADSEGAENSCAGFHEERPAA